MDLFLKRTIAYILVSTILIVRLFRKFDRLKDGESADILGSNIQS